MKDRLTLLLFIIVSALCSQTFGKQCLGTNNGMSLSGNSTDRLAKLIQRFTNCTTIEGNLEISSLPVDADLSFLHSIEEVTGYILIFDINTKVLPLPRLRLIRGEEPFVKELPHPITRIPINSSFSLIIILNQGLTELGLNSLIEISDGDVYLAENKDLCFDNKVMWNDTFANENSRAYYDPSAGPGNCHCHESCSEFKGNQYCWGPEEAQCQNLTKVACKEECGGRCFGTDWNQCCSESCAGGCTGKSNKECFQCRAFSDELACVDSCPPPHLYDHLTFQWKPNPKVKYAYGHECLVQCPEHLYVANGACVRRCPEGNMAMDGVCQPCDGPCPRGCPGTGKTFLSNLNIESFRGCTIIEGSLRISETSFQREYDYVPLTREDLSLLENVTKIEGTLYVDAYSDSFKNLSFLRNVKTIMAKEPVNNRHGFYVFKTSLESLGLDSLETVVNGKVVIVQNMHLCYMDNLDLQTIRKSPADIIVKDNRNVTECELENKVCHPECTSIGCFGPLDSQCLKCKSHKQGNRCVPSCEVGWFASKVQPTEEGSVIVCMKCHEQCEGSCFGPAANECHDCLNYKDGPYCVETCPDSKFPSESGSCNNCSSTCIGGCVGPEDNLGPRGCRECSMVVMDESGTTEVRCLPPDSSCPRGHYKYRNKQCHLCHSECHECLGGGSSNCDLSTCKNAIYDGKCVSKCPGNYYADVGFKPPQCHECHEQCLTCRSQGPTACNSCRILKLYLNDDLMGEFECVDECPPSAPFKIQENIDGSYSTICVSSEHTSEEMTSPKKSNAGLIVGLIVGTLVLIAAIVTIVFFLRRQRSRWDLERMKIEAKMGGFDDEAEPLAPTGAAPDKAQLRIIRESEIRKEEVIGSGAFGTVHKGVWVPADENVRIPVAIKVLNEGTSASQNKELLDEARIMASVDHPNCVRIAAICMTNPIQLIQPLMPFGSLLDYLRKNKNCIGSRALLRWTTQIAKGMKYLEDRGIVHRDLAARNVLVRNANHVKITDFGLSKLLDVDQSQVEAKDGKLPIKWMAIESIRHRIFTHKSDVWSYGVTIWELFTYGQRPYEYLSAVDVLETLEKGERLSQPDICTIDVYMIMIKCWMVDAASRPNFQELVEEFSKMSKDPGRYLVIQGDQFMKLPVQNIDTRDLVKDDGPEAIMSAEDYYLQPVEAKGSTGVQADGNNYINTPKPRGDSEDASHPDLKKGRDDKTQSQMEGNKYTTDPTERKAQDDYLGEKELDFEIAPGSDYDPLAALVVGERQQQKE